MCNCHDRYKGEEGKEILKEIAKKYYDAFGKNLYIQMASDGYYFLSESNPDKDVQES